MDRIDSVADAVDKQRLQTGSDTDCAQKLRIAVQDLRQVPLLLDCLLALLPSVCTQFVAWHALMSYPCCTNACELRCKHLGFNDCTSATSSKTSTHTSPLHVI